MSEGHARLPAPITVNVPTQHICTLLIVQFLGAAVATGQGTFPGEARETGVRHTALAKLDRAGVPRSLYNVQSEVLPGSPEEVARAFLAGQRGLLKLSATDLELRTSRVSRIPGGFHVRFEQTYRGIPVPQGDVVVSGDGQSRVTMLMNNSLDEIRLPSVSPAFDRAEAIIRVGRHLGVRGRPIGKEHTAALVVYRDADGRDHLAYQVSMTCEEPYGDWRVFIDAHSGLVLTVEDVFVEAGTRSTARGRGYVYLSDPLSAARQPYGAHGFVDGDNADTDSLSAYRTLVALDSLVVEDGMASLRGPWCEVTEIEAPEDPVRFTESSPDSFLYTRAHPAFEAVMAYYHVTRAYGRLRELGYELPQLAALRVDPHGFQGKDNSHYSPSGHWMSFGTGGVNDAEDADVIWHEYGHAIHYSVVPFWGGGEMAALGEGFGDYWAGSYSRSLRQWSSEDPAYEWLFNWDGHNPFWSGRILNDRRCYPFEGLSPHMAGQIWASTLMAIQTDLGRDLTDRLVVKSLFYLGSGATAVDAAQALLQADRDLCGGAHLPVLEYWLGTVKGFLPPPERLDLLIVDDDINQGVDSVFSRDKGFGLVPGDSRTIPSAQILCRVAVQKELGVQMTTFAGLDTSRLGLFRAVVMVGGLNPLPFDNAATREKVVSYVRSGGKILTEGGEVGYHYRAWTGGDIDPLFRAEVLHHAAFYDDAGGSTLRIGHLGARLFSAPFAVSDALEFTPASPFVARDAIGARPGDVGTSVLAHWSTAPDHAGILSHRDGTGETHTVFLAFALSTLQDSVAAIHLAANALDYLLDTTREATAMGGATGLPVTTDVRQNYPNPFNPKTEIQFQVAETCHLQLRIYDVLGREVATLVDERKEPGVYAVTFDASGLASGTYLYRLEAHRSETSHGGTVFQTRKMMLVR